MPTETEQANKRRRGDIRADGSIFWGYSSYFRKDGGVTKMEKWVSQESYQKTMHRDRQWRLNNKEKLKAYTKTYETNRRQKDPAFRLIKSLRSRMWGVLCGKKDAPSLALLGCSLEQFKTHLMGQFTGAMSWDNFGSYWHVDHILPLAWFDLSDPNQQKWACHYTNLQPLTKTDNLRKNSKIQWRGTTATE
jgi:hypothetical protein